MIQKVVSNFFLISTFCLDIIKRYELAGLEAPKEEDLIKFIKEQYERDIWNLEECLSWFKIYFINQLNEILVNKLKKEKLLKSLKDNTYKGNLPINYFDIYRYYKNRHKKIKVLHYLWNNT